MHPITCSVDHHRQPVERTAHVARDRAQVHLDRRRKAQHRAGSRAARTKRNVASSPPWRMRSRRPAALPAALLAGLQSHRAHVEQNQTNPAPPRSPHRRVTAPGRQDRLEDGYCRVPGLLPGTYEIRVQMKGFKTAIRAGVEHAAQTIVGVNLAREVGAVAETLTVLGEAPLVETQATKSCQLLRRLV